MKVSISIDKGDLAVLKGRARESYRGNLSAAFPEAARSIRQRTARTRLVDMLGGPSLTASAAGAIDAEQLEPPKVAKRARRDAQRDRANLRHGRLDRSRAAQAPDAPGTRARAGPRPTDYRSRRCRCPAVAGARTFGEQSSTRSTSSPSRFAWHRSRVRRWEPCLEQPSLTQSSWPRLHPVATSSTRATCTTSSAFAAYFRASESSAHRSRPRLDRASFPPNNSGATPSGCQPGRVARAPRAHYGPISTAFRCPQAIPTAPSGTLNLSTLFCKSAKRFGPNTGSNPAGVATQFQLDAAGRARS